jgi:site-specific DNA-cytosine methylase
MKLGLQGGVATTLNVMDNTGDSRATVLIFYGNRVDDIRIQGDVINTLQARMGTGGGNMPMVFEPKSAFEENWAESEVKNALRANASKSNHAVVYSIREDAKANKFSATETEIALALQAHQPSVQSHHAQLFIDQPPVIRRLTPIECERLQGFPDNWTENQADTHRYKQMGNAVAVPVVSWIVNRLMGAANDLD